MEHRHRTDEEILTLVLRLQPFGASLSSFLRVSSNDLLALFRNSANADLLARELEDVRSCALCRHGFETFWEEETEGERHLRVEYPDVVPVTQRSFRRAPASAARTRDAVPAGSAASDTPPGPVCEITCTAEGMLIRILAEPDGTATAVLFMTQGSPEGVVLRFDGNEAEFGASGVIQLPKMPLRIGVERRPPRPGGS